MDQFDEYTQEKLDERLALIEKELRDVEGGGGFDAIVSVSKDEQDTIQNLTEMTAKFFRDDGIRRLYTAAQVARVDMKVDLAVIETMRIYRRVLRAATISSFVAYASMTSKFAGGIALSRTLVSCFGLPSVGSRTVYDIIRGTIWGDASHNVTIGFAETLSTIGMLATGGLSGMPVFLATGAINVPLVVPATTRLLLALATDVILVLVRAFKNVTDRCIGQPQIADVQAAAAEYRQLAPEVRRRALAIVPRRNPVKCFRTSAVQVGFSTLLAEYKTLMAGPEIARGSPAAGVDVTEDEREVAADMAEIEECVVASAEVARQALGKRGSRETVGSEETVLSEMTARTSLSAR